MFDLRYHVASLAAVFFALVIGILVGVALASHGLGNTERDRLQEDLRRATGRGDALQAQVDALEQSGTANRAFVEQTYQLVMEGRLKGKRIAVLFVGPKDADVRKAITQTLSDAGAGEPVRVRYLDVPINVSAISRVIAKRPFLGAYAGEKQLNHLGQALGQEFAAGKETPLWNALNSVIVGETFGSLEQPADGIVVVRTAPAQTAATARFLKGLYAGMGQVGAPAIGVEVSAGDGSSIEAFQDAHLSTVDNIDMQTGKLALAIMLGDGTVTGDFGDGDSSKTDGFLPDLPPPPATTTGG
jgi:Copper transport outer membrane protein, MctB